MSRVADKFRAHRVAARFQNRFSMSLTDAARLLGVNISASPEEVNAAYRKKFIENRRLNPDLPGADSTAARDLNIAKDTLLGVLRPDRGTPQRPSPPPPPVEKDPEPSVPVPVPEGISYSEAISTGGFKWYAGTYAGSKTDYAQVDPNDRSTTYVINHNSRILLGKNSSHYAILKLTYVTHGYARATYKNGEKPVGRWRVLINTFSNQEKFLKVAPKVIKEMNDYAHRPKFLVFENHRPTEAEVDKTLRGRLSLKDALIGSGLVSIADDKELDNRKIQVELEPVLNRERYNSTDKGERRGKMHFMYDWHLYFNGRKVKTLERDEVDRLDKKHIFSSLYDYDYEKGKKNLTRLKGGRLKYDAKTAIQLMAEALDPGSEKETLERLSESM